MLSLSYDPSREWDAYCQREEEALRQMMKEYTCGECRHSVFPDFRFPKEMKECIAWCTEHDMFVDPKAHAEDYDCEEVQP